MACTCIVSSYSVASPSHSVGKIYFSPLYLVSQLVELQNATRLCNDLKYVIVPSVNPDGYEYSLQNDPNWRKTRKPVGMGCTGTDGNRNFGFHWGEGGASSVPCLDTYKGTDPFSEPETQLIRDLLAKYASETKFYLTIHSYGRYILYPWGYKYEVSEDWRVIDRVSQRKKFRVNIFPLRRSHKLEQQQQRTTTEQITWLVDLRMCSTLLRAEVMTTLME